MSDLKDFGKVLMYRCPYCGLRNVRPLRRPPGVPPYPCHCGADLRLVVPDVEDHLLFVRDLIREAWEGGR